MPNFTNFKTTNNRLRSQPIFKTCRKLLLTTELSNHKSDLHHYNSSIKSLKNNELFDIESTDLNSIQFILDNEILNNYRHLLKQKSLKKLNNLGIALTMNDIIVNNAFISDRNKNRANKVKKVYDLSHDLDEKEIDLLSKGLKFGVQNRNFNHFEILSRFEELAENLEKEQISIDFRAKKSTVTPLDSFMNKLSFLAEDYIKSSEIRQNSLTLDEEKTLNNLKLKVKECDLIINKSDKGNAAVVNKKSDYITKMQLLFSDKTKFELVVSPDLSTIEKLEKDFNDRLLAISDEVDKDRKITDENGNEFFAIKKHGSINQRIYKQLHSTGAKCAVAYGLTKVHKKDLPIRPIISTIGTYNYSTSGYLGKILEEHFNSNIIAHTETVASDIWLPQKRKFKYTLKDSFDFINKLSKIKIDKDDFIISIDVESLFTNVPIDETIEIIKKNFFRKKNQKIDKKDKNIGTKNIRKGISEYDGSFDGLPWEHFEFLFRNCLQESIFTFDNKLYKQIDGVSMGSRLGPITSDIFMNDFETKHMPDLVNLGVKTWLRYVDDIFVIIKSKDEADKILEFLNSLHKTIKFTMEKQINDSLNFLDVKLTRNMDGSVSTSTYRKPTFTGVMLNWNSLTSIKYKKGLINCLLDRSNKICSSNEQKILEMEDLRNILLANNYPSLVIDKQFEKFEKYKQLNVDKITNPDEKIKYLSLPFINDKSETIARKIQETVRSHFSNINLRVAFKSPATLSSHFPFKDKVTDPSKLSMVVYHLKCKNCDADYIGQSKRICNIRMDEHQKPTKNKTNPSHVYEHNIIPGHEIDFDNVVILDRADSVKKLELKEMLYIRKLKPTLNKQKESELFTLIIRNVKMENSITRDIQKYLKPKPRPIPKH